MSPDELTRRYDAVAPRWEAKLRRTGYDRAYAEFVRSALSRRRPVRHVCDVGSGCGSFSSALVDAHGALQSLTLVDESQAMLAQGERALREQLRSAGCQLTCHRQSLGEYKPSHRFDAVLAAHLIEHCPDQTEALAALWRLVAPGGLLLIVVSRPHWCQWLIWISWRHRWFSEAEIRGASLAAGLPRGRVHQFTSGPPSRTSLGYMYEKPDDVDRDC